MKVHGTYTSEVGAASAIQELNAMGYERSAIRVVASRHLGPEFDTVETVETTGSSTHDEDDRGFFAKIRDFFSFSEYSDDAYANMDADSRSVLRDYRSNLDKGEIVILVDDDGRSASADDAYTVGDTTDTANAQLTAERETGTPINVEPKPDPDLTKEEEELLDLRPEDRNR